MGFDVWFILRTIFLNLYAATCWAVAIVRVVQALLNIGVVVPQQLELSIQHIVNHVNFDAERGINNIRNALSFMKSSGVCLESRCRSHGRQLVRKNCTHQQVRKLNYLFSQLCNNTTDNRFWLNLVYVFSISTITRWMASLIWPTLKMQTLKT